MRVYISQIQRKSMDFKKHLFCWKTHGKNSLKYPPHSRGHLNWPADQGARQILLTPTTNRI